MDYGRPVRKSPSLQGQKSTPNPNFLCMAKAHRPKFSDFFDLCLHWLSVVRGYNLEQPVLPPAAVWNVVQS